MKGFSLLEIIIAMALLLVTVLVFGIAVNALPLTKGARNQNIAYHIAEKKLEELRNTPFAILPAGGSFADPDLANLPGGMASLTLQDHQGSSEIKEVNITVTWDDYSGPRSVILDTLISQIGLNP